MKPAPQTDAATPDVLIVGAGPAGLTAAVVLAAHGVHARVVDAEDGPTTQSRALVVQARTLELWDKLGLAEGAIDGGKVVTGAVGFSDGTPMNGGHPLLNFAALGAGQTPFPFLLVFEQSKTERLLLDKLTEYGGTVEWGVRMDTLTQDLGSAEVTLRHGDGRTEIIRPRWVIGADGASSAVRRALELGFEGGSYEQRFFLADAAVTWSQTPEYLYLVIAKDGTFLFVPMPTDPGETPRYRVLGSVTDQMAAKKTLDVEDVQIAIDEHARVRATVSDPRWVSLYRLHHRMAERFRVGHVFLAGDAAHIHSPVGGQGMNTGIQDAYNLAWKLALVVTGQARPVLLDTYATERMPVARALLDSTDNAFTNLVSENPAKRMARKAAIAVLPTALRRATGTTRRLFATISQIAITYALPHSPDDPRITTGPRPGDRAPHAIYVTGPHAGKSFLHTLTGPSHHLLILSRTATDSALDKPIDELLANRPVVVDVHTIAPGETLIHDAYGITEPTLMLIRPDGYLAWRGPTQSLTALADYLDSWYNTTAPEPGSASRTLAS